MSFFQKHKQMAGALMLVSFMMLVVFGLTAMTHERGGQMQGGCPFSVFGASLCPQNMLAVALHQISSYQALLSVPAHFAATTLAFFVFFALCVALVCGAAYARSTLRPRAFIGGAPPSAASYRKITRWLSLFENSPSS